MDFSKLVDSTILPYGEPTIKCNSKKENCQKISTIFQIPLGHIPTSKPRKSLPPFSPIGPLRMKGKQKIKQKDIVDVMEEMTTPERRLFRQIKNHINPLTWDAILPSPETPSKRVVRSQAYTKLKNRNCVRKVGQGCFMINPALIIPPKDIGEYIRNKWQTLK
jgi:hypothetical protein